MAALIFLGVAHRVLDRMRLNDTQALLILGALFVSPFLPDIAITPGLRIDLAGALIPLAIAVYLIATADEALERTRALVATAVTAAAVFATEQLLP
ncbi:MAG TPA: stage II sporulation protein P, partial [Bacillota bacterium]